MDDDADIIENRSDRRVRFVDGDFNGFDARESGKDRVGDGTGGRSADNNCVLERCASRRDNI